jgi:hypothetical protein
MNRPDYASPAPPEAEARIRAVFALGGVGYVALDWRGTPIMRMAEGLVTETTPETNFYEEYLVNPTLLALASRRGALDCGGVRYLSVGYGGFIQIIAPTPEGHISIGVSKNRNVEAFMQHVAAILRAEARS